MTTMRRQLLDFGKDSATYGIGSMVMRFLALFLTPVFTAHLVPQDYGVLAMLGLLTMVLQPIFSLSLGAVLGPVYFEGGSVAKSRALWTTFAIHTACAVLLMVMAWWMPAQLAAIVRLPAEHVGLVRMALASCALTIVTTAWMQRVQFEKQAKLYVAVTAASALISLVASAVAVVVAGWGAAGVLVGQLAGGAVSFLAFLYFGLRATRPVLSVKAAKELLRMGLPMTPSFAFIFVITQSNKYILEWQMGLHAVGVYSIGFNFGSVISIVTGAVSMAWYPFLMSYMDRQSEVRVLFGRLFTYYVFGIGYLCLIFFFAARPVMLLLTHESYYEGAVVVGLVALSYFLQVVFSLFMTGLYFRKEVAYVSLVQGIAALITLASNYIFIRLLGVFGAGIGIAFGSFALAATMHVWNRWRAASYPVIDYEWRRIGLFVIGSTMLIVLDAMVVTPTLTGEIVKAAVASVLGIGLLFVCSNAAERSAIKSAGLKWK
jgi:O-antigen/teichoic acid export membrane protein